MTQLEAWYTREHKIYVVYFCGLTDGFRNATFTDLHQVREMLPLPIVQQIETCLGVI
jgi:hypothetical protein